MKKIILLIISGIITSQILPCTTVVVSGKYTKDGRPMIWKLRDTESYENKMMYFTDGKYEYIGLINSNDIEGTQVWSGSNSIGFAIMNSASFNVNLNDSTSKKDLEGFVMKKALQTCETIEDFENLLKNLEKPMGLAAHFGVIDAKGGAAFYEVNNYTFTKFDANNPTQAPNGYILRTNFSYTGKKDIGYGFIRFQTAQNLLAQADAMSNLNYKTIVQDFSRCFKHAVLNKDYRSEYENIPEGAHFINSGDLITRHGSSSAILIRGVKEKEPADLSTIWITVGYPNCCVALPLWVRGGNELPSVLTAEKDKNCALNQMALQLKDECYPIKRSAGYKYLQISKLINAEKTGIVQKIELAEEKIFKETQNKYENWIKNNPNKEDIVKFYNWLDKYVRKTYKKNFGIEL